MSAPRAQGRLSFLGFLSGKVLAAPPVALVNVDTQQLGAKIPRDFLGFSNEVSTARMGLQIPSAEARGNIQPPPGIPENAYLAFVLGEPAAPNTGFFAMMRDLGPGVLRQGGNTQENTCWNAKGAPHPARLLREWPGRSRPIR